MSELLRKEAIRRGLIQSDEKKVARPKVTLGDIRIQTKDRRIVPFRPNVDQVKLLDECVPGWREEDYTGIRATRELILKARQLGFSTLIEILFFIDTINTPNTRTVILSKDKKTAGNIFLMVKTMYDLLPEEKRPHASTSSQSEYYWPELNSRYESYSVGTAGVGRSMTIQNLHWSEVAHSRKSQEASSDIFAAVPQDGNIFLETTAKGTGEFFHQEWIKAEEGESSFTHRFVNWLQNKEYERDPRKVPDFTSEADLKREQVLRELYGLTERQLAFRREKMREPGMRKKFVQEYPISAREAFISSGDPFFDNEKLNDLYELYNRKDPVLSGEVDFHPYHLLVKAYAEGELRLFDLPEPGEHYVVAADPSEGLMQSGITDYCGTQVFRHRDHKQVAVLKGKWDTESYGRLLDQLGHFYNTALVGVERNNHGHAVLVTLITICAYPNVYEHEEYDQRTDTTFKKPGFPTTSKTRTQALDELDSAIIFGDIRIVDKNTLSECISFVKLKGGKYAADSGCHDDLVMSLAIGNQLLKQPIFTIVTPVLQTFGNPSIGQLIRGFS